VAQEFDFNNPLGLAALDPYKLDEEERALNDGLVDLDNKQAEESKNQELQPQEKTVNDFDWVNPLKGVGLPTDIETRAAEFALETFVKPIMAYGYEADQRYPDAFWDTFLYTKDAATTVPGNLRDRAVQMWESFKLQSAEDMDKKLKGEIPFEMIGPGGTYISDDWGQAYLARKYEKMSEEEKNADEAEMQEIRNETLKVIGDLNKKINKRQNDANLGEYGKSVSSGLESMAVITTSMVLNGLSGGKLTAPTTAATLSYFGLQTQATSYAEARRQGKGHEQALAYGNIQGLLEVGTEALPVFRYLKPRSPDTVSRILKEGFKDVATDTSMEVLNGVLQEVNTALFDLESDLRTAYDNRNNPLYEGPTMVQVLQDVAGHSFLSALIASGSITSVRSTGQVMYSPEVANFIKENKDDPMLDEFVNNFNTLVNNSSLNYEAIDKAVVQMFDPNYSSGVTSEELLADSFLNTNFIRLQDPVQGDIVVEKAEGIINKVNEKFPEKFKDFSFIDPMSKETKQVKTFLSGEEIYFGSKYYDQTTAEHSLQEASLPADNLIRNDTYQQDEIDIVRNRIIYPRRFHEGTLKNIPEFGQLPQEVYRQRLGNTRDLTFDESNNLSKATIDLLNLDMPIDIFTDLRYIGVESVDPREGLKSHGAYEPMTQSISLNPYIGLKTAEYENQIGAKTQLRHTFAHELAHHIDYGIGRDVKSSYQIYSPASISSPLFNIPNLNNIDMVQDGSTLLEITDPDGGAVMMEALNIHINNPQGYHDGAMLKYPLSQLMSYHNMNALTESMLDMVKAETFAQMYSLYYTNRDFLRANAPETFALIERLNDAISVDSLREKNARVLQAFRSSRAPRSLEIPPRRAVDETPGRLTEEQQPSGRLEAETPAADRDRIRSELPRLNNTSLLDFIKQNPDGFTVDPETLESPSSGFAVAPVKALELIVDQNQIDEDVIRQYAKNIKNLADAMDRPVFAGGWLNSENNKYYLDATVLFDTIEDALYTAEAANQEAVFDLGTFNETRTKEGIEELKQTDRYSSQARDERAANIRQLGEIFQQTRLESQRIEKRVQQPVDLADTITPTDIGAMLTKGDSSFLFRQYSNIQELAVDKLDRLKGFMEKLKPYLPEGMKDLDIIRSTDTFYGKVKTKLDDAVQEVDGLLKHLKASKIKEDQFNSFLKNLHAPERNKAINAKYEKELPALKQKLKEEKDPKKIPPLKGQITKRENVLKKYQDSGSGIKTDVAIANLREMGIEYNVASDVVKPLNDMGKNLLKGFDMLNEYQNKTRQAYIENDLVSEETVADWSANYQYYVPLVGFAVDTIDGNKPEPSGGGRSLYGAIIPEAKGRKSEAGNPLEQAILRRSEAAVLGERNEINKELAALIRQFPAKNIWDVKGAQKFQKPNKWDGEQSLIPFKEEGKTKFLVIRDERLARGLDEFGNQTMNPFIRMMRGITSTLSALYTSYSPEFVVTNFTRDYQTGYFNLLAEKEIAGGRALGKQLKGALNPGAMVKTLRELRHGYVTDKLKSRDPEAYKYFRAFLENGGQTGYVNARDVDQIQAEMLRLSKAHDGFPLNPIRTFNSVGKFVESVNNVAENASRFAVFKSFVKEAGGIDKASKTDIANAANLAKNLTINFNRSGRLGPYVNAFYVFANAAVQGNVNFFRGMVPFKFDANGNIQYQPISKAKKYVMAGGIGFGGLVALYNTLVSGEDEDGKLFIDKIPQHEQERNLIIMIPGVKRSRGTPIYNRETRQYEVNGKPVAFTIPLPYGYNIFFNMGRMGMETATTDIAGYERRSPVEFAKDISGIAAGAFSPVGVAYDKEGIDLGKTAVPSFIKPVFDVYINEKWTGAPVYKEQYYGSKLPISSTKLKNTEEFYREFTQMLNQVDIPVLGIEGGGEADPGSINVSPDVIKYLLQSYLGGMYTTAERSYNGIEKAIDISQGINRDVTLNEIPFGRIFTAEPENYTDALEFYRYKEFLRGTPNQPNKGLVTSYKSYVDQGDKEALESFIQRRDFKDEYLALDKSLAKFETKLTKLNQKERLAEKLKETDRLRYFNIINEIETERNKLHQEFNKIARPIIGRQ